MLHFRAIWQNCRKGLPRQPTNAMRRPKSACEPVRCVERGTTIRCGDVCRDRNSRHGTHSGYGYHRLISAGVQSLPGRRRAQSTTARGLLRPSSPCPAARPRQAAQVQRLWRDVYAASFSRPDVQQCLQAGALPAALGLTRSRAPLHPESAIVPIATRVAAQTTRRGKQAPSRAPIPTAKSGGSEARRP